MSTNTSEVIINEFIKKLAYCIKNTPFSYPIVFDTEGILNWLQYISETEDEVALIPEPLLKYILDKSLKCTLGLWALGMDNNDPFIIELGDNWWRLNRELFFLKTPNQYSRC